jgi:hypothetical protein
MQEAELCHIREWHNVVEKLRQDQAAVQAGLTLPWRNGVVEGHVNRLTCLKRTMYGRVQIKECDAIYCITFYKIISAEPTGFGVSLSNAHPLPGSTWPAVSQASRPCA